MTQLRHARVLIEGLLPSLDGCDCWDQAAVRPELLHAALKLAEARYGGGFVGPERLCDGQGGSTVECQCDRCHVRHRTVQTFATACVAVASSLSSTLVRSMQLIFKQAVRFVVFSQAHWGPDAPCCMRDIAAGSAPLCCKVPCHLQLSAGCT